MVERLFVLPLLATLLAPPALYRAPGAPVAFAVPAGWTVRVVRTDSLALASDTGDAIGIRVVALPLADAAERLGITTEGAAWGLPGAATPFATRHAAGLRGAQGDWEYALLSRGAVTVAASTRWTPEVDRAFGAVVASLRFE